MKSDTSAPTKQSRVNTEQETIDIKSTKSLQILVVLATLYTLYFAQSLILPIIFAAFIALLLSPLVNKLKRFHIPRAFSAIVLLATLVAPFSLLSVELAEPVQKWLKLLPKLSAHVTQELHEFDNMLQPESSSDESADDDDGFFSKWFSEEEEPPKPKEGVVQQKLKQGGLDAILAMVSGTPLFIAQFLGSLILILFLLIFGPPLFKVFLNEFPLVKDKQKASSLVKSIQRALSNYIITVSLINIGLGASTAVALSFLGIEDALLWGALVAVMNFVPYVGSVVSASILLLVGIVQFDLTLFALVPSALFLCINILESQLITPAILGKSMRVNPLIIIVWLLLAGWLWGVLGILLAVPLLVCIKLTIEKLEVWPHWLKFIEASEADLR